MQINWSFVLNILLLAGVFVAIARMVKNKRKESTIVPQQPSVGMTDKTASYDDIIAVRKVYVEQEEEVPSLLNTLNKADVQVSAPPVSDALVSCKPSIETQESGSVVIFLLAKTNRQLAGYELLQTLLACGLRFGDGNLFHRHQHKNGQGPVLCSVAAATASGVFDLQNIGAFSTRGLCLFMMPSGNATIDAERFGIMLDTARQLSEDLDAHLLDDERRPLSDASIERYHRRLNISEMAELA